jgi:hypothetical protein
LNELARAAAKRRRREQQERITAMRIAMLPPELFQDAIKELTE